jgi:HEAT repeat protein
MKTVIQLSRAFVLSSLIAVSGTAWADLSPERIEEFRPVIVEGLSSTDATTLVLAVRAAVYLNDDELLPSVVEHLEHPDARVRAAAAMALLSVGESDEEAREVLAALLTGPDPDARVNVLERVLPLLPEVEQTAILRASIDAALDNTETLRPILLYIAQRGQGATFQLLTIATTAPDAIADIVNSVLLQSGRPEATSIADALIATGDPVRMGRAADILIGLNSIESRTSLAALLTASDAALAQRAGFHLANYGNNEALSLVAALAFNTAQPLDLRIQAINLLAERGPLTSTVDEIRALAAEPAAPAELRQAAFAWLGATRDPAALQTLREMFDGFFADQRIDALAGLGFAGNDAPTGEIVMIMSGSGEPALRLGAAHALGRIATPEAVSALTQQLMMESEDEMKVAIIEALGISGASEAAQPIANEFASQNPTTALAALNALNRLGNTSIARQVESVATTNRDPGVRWRATVVMAGLSPDIGNVRLMQALSRPPEGFLADIAHLSPDVLREIDEMLLTHADQQIRSDALFRVLGRADGGYSVLRPILEGRSAPEVRAQALAVVAAQRRIEDAPLFRQLTEDPDRTTRLRALMTLAELGDPAQTEFFEEYVGHADATLRLLAAWALLNLDAQT